MQDGQFTRLLKFNFTHQRAGREREREVEVLASNELLRLPDEHDNAVQFKKKTTTTNRFAATLPV